MSFWFEDRNGKWLDDITSGTVLNLADLSPPKSKTRQFLDQGSGDAKLIKAALSELASLPKPLPSQRRLLRILKKGLPPITIADGNG